MADNIVISTGQTTAADDLAGVYYPRVKVAVGADGAAADVQPPDAEGKASSSILPSGTQIWNGASWDRARVPSADGLTSQGLQAVQNQRFNGATYDREYGNTSGTLLASAARTVQTFTAQQTNYNARGVTLILNATVNPGGGRTLLIDVQHLDPVSGSFPGLVTFAAQSTNFQIVTVYPGVVTSLSVAPVAVNLPLPRGWRAVVTPSDGASWTYSLGYSYIL